jgi:hypothetical protein
MTALVSLIMAPTESPDHGIVSEKARSTVVPVERSNRVSMMGGRRRESFARRRSGLTAQGSAANHAERHVLEFRR